MNEQEQKMKEKLEDQFNLLVEKSKECEPECLENLTDSMLKIYATLNQDYQFPQE